MKKFVRQYGILWIICIILFNIIAFILPVASKYSSAFWTGYSFISASFLGQFICTYYVAKSDTAEKTFYRIPMALVSYIGVVIALAIGACIMLIPRFPLWMGIILSMVVLAAILAIEILAASAAAGISATDKRIRTSAIFMRTLAADAEHLMNVANTREMQLQTRKIYEAIRFSDYVSNMALNEIDEAIQCEFSSFQETVYADDLELAKACGIELLLQIDKRNKKCKAIKK